MPKLMHQAACNVAGSLQRCVYHLLPHMRFFVEQTNTKKRATCAFAFARNYEILKRSMW